MYVRQTVPNDERAQVGADGSEPLDLDGLVHQIESVLIDAEGLDDISPVYLHLAPFMVVV